MDNSQCELECSSLRTMERIKYEIVRNANHRTQREVKLNDAVHLLIFKVTIEEQDDVKLSHKHTSGERPHINVVPFPHHFSC